MIVLRYITIRRYQVSATVLIATVLLVSVAIGAAAYLWATRTIPVSVQEPLAVTNYPATISTHPGENMTLNITITDSASADFAVTLRFNLNDTTYQQSYVQFSNYTYSIVPGSNQIQGWLKVAGNAPPADLQLTVQFERE